MAIARIITALLAPSKGTRNSRRAWGIDVETVWIPFFTATNVKGATHLDDDLLGAPIRLAKTKDGEVRFDQNGRPRMRVAPELNAQITLVKENFVSGLVSYAGTVAEELPDAYREQVESAQKAGEVVMEQQSREVADAAEAEVAQTQPAPEPNPQAAQNRRRPNTPHAESDE
jgi:hypothetical protein